MTIVLVSITLQEARWTIIQRQNSQVRLSIAYQCNTVSDKTSTGIWHFALTAQLTLATVILLRSFIRNDTQPFPYSLPKPKHDQPKVTLNPCIAKQCNFDGTDLCRRRHRANDIPLSPTIFNYRNLWLATGLCFQKTPHRHSRMEWCISLV